jgi:hypothetical protein
MSPIRQAGVSLDGQHLSKWMDMNVQDDGGEGVVSLLGHDEHGVTHPHTY